ncbi:MAG TPA: VC0807 family protein [Pseudonocardiaceae bacterium]|jgi:hypothetical protein
MTSQPAEPRSGFSRPNLRTFLPNLLITWLVPLAAYELISPHLHSDLLALTISAAIPALVTIGTYVFRRRVNVIGLISVVGFAIGLAVSVFTGGNELAIKLHEPVLTGLAGLIFLGSVAIGRPLFLLTQRLRGGTMDKRRASVLSLLIGATLVVHGIVVTILAVTLPTSTFLALSRPIGLPIIAIGIGVMFLYGRRSASVSRQSK